MPRPGRAAPREAAGADRAVVGGGRQYSALPLESRGAIEILGAERPQLVQAARPLRLLPGRRRGPRVGRAEHPQPLVHDRRRARDRHARGQRRDVLAGRALRRPRPLRSDGNLKYVYNWVGDARDKSSSPTSRSRPATSSSPPRSTREGHTCRPRHPHASTSATTRSAKQRSRPSPASSHSAATASTSARTAPSRSPTTTRGRRALAVHRRHHQAGHHRRQRRALRGPRRGGPSRLRPPVNEVLAARKSWPQRLGAFLYDRLTRRAASTCLCPRYRILVPGSRPGARRGRGRAGGTGGSRGWAARRRRRAGAGARRRPRSHGAP